MASTVKKTKSGILRVLEICRDIELVCGQLYSYYAEIFHDDLELARMWSKTAMEEEEHARQFTMAINLGNEWAIEAVTVDKNRAESMLGFIESLYEVARTHTPTGIDALRSAIMLESTLDEFHMDVVAQFTDNSHHKFFTFLKDADRGHVAVLEAEYAKLADYEEWLVRNA